MADYLSWSRHKGYTHIWGTEQNVQLGHNKFCSFNVRFESPLSRIFYEIFVKYLQESLLFLFATTMLCFLKWIGRNFHFFLRAEE